MRNKMESSHLDRISESLPTKNSISFKSQWLKWKAEQNK